ASARARVQSSESTAAVAAEFFKSVLREVGMAFLPGLSVVSKTVSLMEPEYLEVRAKVNTARGRHSPRDKPAVDGPRAWSGQYPGVPAAPGWGMVRAQSVSTIEKRGA